MSSLVTVTKILFFFKEPGGLGRYQEEPIQIAAQLSPTVSAAKPDSKRESPERPPPLRTRHLHLSIPASGAYQHQAQDFATYRMQNTASNSATRA